MGDLTLHEQARGVHSLPLDAVRPAGVGAPVLPADGEHRQAPVAHLGTKRDSPGAQEGTDPSPAPSVPHRHSRVAAGALSAR